MLDSISRAQLRTITALVAFVSLVVAVVSAVIAWRSVIEAARSADEAKRAVDLSEEAAIPRLKVRGRGEVSFGASAVIVPISIRNYGGFPAEIENLYLTDGPSGELLSDARYGIYGFNFEVVMPGETVDGVMTLEPRGSFHHIRGKSGIDYFYLLLQYKALGPPKLTSQKCHDRSTLRVVWGEGEIPDSFRSDVER